MKISQRIQVCIFSILLLFATSLPTQAADATFSWNANPEPVSGYKIYYGTSSRQYSFAVDVGLPEAINGVIIASIEGLQKGYTYYFAATAYSANEESDYSAEVVYTVPGAISSNPATPENDTVGNIVSSVVKALLRANETRGGPTFELGELPVTSEWQHVEFSTEFAAPPSVVAKATTTNDPQTGYAAIRNVTSQGFDIHIREWDNADGRHSEETVSFLAMDRGHHQIDEKVAAIAECINISGLNSYESVTFANALPSQPVVISSLVTDNGPNATTLRMKDITNQGFSITMQEQESNVWSHSNETVCFIAMEKWEGLVSDLIVEVGSTEATLTDTTTTIPFNQHFPTIPIVFADMQSANDGDTAILGISSLSATGFGVTIIEEQSANDAVNHQAETGGYIAVTPLNPQEEGFSDETQVPPKHFNAATMSAIISMFNDLTEKL